MEAKEEVERVCCCHIHQDLLLEEEDPMGSAEAVPALVETVQVAEVHMIVLKAVLAVR